MAQFVYNEHREAGKERPSLSSPEAYWTADGERRTRILAVTVSDIRIERHSPGELAVEDVGRDTQ